MLRVFSAAASAAILSVIFFAKFNLSAQIPEPEEYRKSERAKMLQILEAGYPVTDLVVAKLEDADPRNQALVDYYMKVIRPVERQLAELSFKSNWYAVALDRALYNDDEEQEAWEAIKQETADAIDAITNSDAHKERIKKWAQLAEGLTGALADQAEGEWESIELESFSETLLPLLREKNDLNVKIDAAANESTFGNNLGEVAEKIGQIKADYLAKKITLQKAGELVEEQRARGQAGQSRDIASQVGKEMNRAAAINTMLAKSKGYKTWAEFQIAVQSDPYEDRFNTVAGRIQFLEETLKATDTLMEEYLQNLAAIDGHIRRDQLREAHVEILSPDADGFGAFYPVEKIDDLWVKTALGQGFKLEDTQHIYRDNFPRPSKYTHGYMNEVNTRMPKVVGLDATNLNMTLPASSATEMWHLSNIFIVQNFFSDSMDSIRVAFHEGGHALHYTYEENAFGEPHAYGYVEIHSITQEHFLLDKDFVMATAQTREGRRPTEKEVDDYIRNVKLQEFVAFRILLARALFELKLWDFDYEKSSEGWTERAIKLWGEVISKGTGVSGTENHGVDSTGRGPFNAPHFRAGDLQYIGYSTASIAAYMSVDAIRERLLKETGRSSFLNQPGLAKILIDGYYRKGFERKFPASVETFTGKPYSASSYVEFLAQAIKSMRSQRVNPIRTCNEALPQVRGIQMREVF